MNKLYLWDWSLVEDPSARFENMVALQLLKYCHLMEDAEGYKMELKFLRDLEGRELDFVITKDKKPHIAVECKMSSKDLSANVRYFRERVSIPRFYQVHAEDLAGTRSDDKLA